MQAQLITLHLFHLGEWVGPLEQIAEGTPAPVGQTPAQVLGPIVDQVTALAPGREIAVAVEAGVVLAVAGRQDRYRQPGPRQRLECKSAPK